MSSKPEDRPKLIGLLVAIVGVIVYVLITLVPKFTGAQTAPPAGSAAPPPTLTSASAIAPVGNQAANAQSGSAAPLPDEENDKVPPAPAHDSFTPPASDMSHPPPTPQPAPGVKPAAPGPGPNAAKASVAVTPVAAPVTPALPPVELKGVILGEPAVAVLSVNNEVVQRQAGDQIASGLKLVKIVENGIVLQEGKKQIVVAVGHAMPTLAPPATAASSAPTSQPGKL